MLAHAKSLTGNMSHQFSAPNLGAFAASGRMPVACFSHRRFDSATLRTLAQRLDALSPPTPREPPAQRHTRSLFIRNSGRSLVVAAANGWGNNGSGGDEQSSLGETLGQLSQFVLPAVAAFTVLSLISPIGGITTYAGVVLVLTAVAALTGLLDSLSRALGTTVTTTAGVIATSALGVLLIPTLLKVAVFAAGGFFVYNILFGGGQGSDGNGSADDIDARDITIDVEYETLDD
jgi:hypothetical protein